MRSLAGLEASLQVLALARFREADLKKAANKSGLLSGIMRRLANEATAQASTPPASQDGAASSGFGGDGAGVSDESGAGEGIGESSRALKKRQEAELKK